VQEPAVVQALLEDKMKKKKSIEELKKMPGSEGSFKPVHYKATHPEDPESPNQYAHRVSEAVSTRGTSNSLGGRHRPKRSVFKSRLLPSQRTAWQHSGNQKLTGRYTEEETEMLRKKVFEKVKQKKMKAEETTEKLGRPDTGGSAETISVNPQKEELKGQIKQ